MTLTQNVFSLLVEDAMFFQTSCSTVSAFNHALVNVPYKKQQGILEKNSVIFFIFIYAATEKLTTLIIHSL